MIEYLGYRTSSEGIAPSRGKVRAVEVAPEELKNGSQVKQLLGTIKYCRMFMGPAFADMASPLVELSKKGVGFKWTQEHMNAVKTLKDKLIN